MNIAHINRIVEEIKAAVADERQNHRFKALQQQWAELQGRDANEQEMDDIVQFASDYVWRVPLLLLAMHGAAMQSATQGDVEPLLDVALSYWLEPSDIVPDDLGLFGRIDDAYYVLSILQMISEQQKRADGTPLLALELDALNERMRTVIGEPQASLLDAGVMVAIGAPRLQHLLLNLPMFRSPLLDRDPLQPNSNPEAIAAFQMNALRANA